MSRETGTYRWGDRLKRARLAHGLSQKQLGVLAGIDEAVASARVNRYERGVHMPDLSIAKVLGKVLGVSAAYFYAPEDDLAEFLYRLGQLRAADRHALFRQLAHLPAPPPLPE